MAELLAQSDKEFMITMINVIWTLMLKVDSMQEHMSNVSREMEAPRNKKSRENARKKQKMKHYQK